MAAKKPIRLLIVDDSVVVQKMLAKYLGREPDIEVVGTALDPYEAREKIIELRPDVLTLDIEMPRMDGLQFLEVLMKHAPTPVVIHSSLASTGSQAWLRATELGAVDVVWKPRTAEQLAKRTRMLAQKVRLASQAQVHKLEPRAAGAAPAAVPGGKADESITGRGLLAIGASTGGPPAVEKVITALPANAPGTVIVQHMPKNFTGAFAQRLDTRAAVKVAEAAGGEILERGHVYIAPGDKHMVIQKAGANYRIQVVDGPKVHSCRPAVDPLFESVARHAGRDAVAVVLTGMGSDGAAGMLAMRQAGAVTLAQDEATSVVYGMPKACADLEAAEKILGLDEIAALLAASFRAAGTTAGSRS